ncbi:ribonuclease T2 isoform X2 [Halyomorpha halys]
MQQRSGNTCNSYPKNHWTVHGIWPTRLGTRGPNDCDPSRRFNLQEVGSLQRDLEEWWTPIQVNARKTYFWEHEWEKHGTCAPPVIETQYEYFKQALDWVRQYEMGEIFRTSGIVPGRDYSLSDIMEGIRRVLNKVPQVICYNGNQKSVLLEVRICFDRSLQLVDCNSYCTCDQMVHYPTA